VDATNYVGSYGWNGWAQSQVSGGPPANPRIFVKEAAIQHPTETPYFTDAIYAITYVMGGETLSTDLYNGDSGTGLGKISIARHGVSSAPRAVNPLRPVPGRIMLGMADGHAETAKLNNLVNYYWNAIWPNP
jgi:hypothetical protein